MAKGYVHSLESFGSVDGPGVRYVIFTAGCPMRCQFCHNPDTWDIQGGTPYEAKELIQKALRYRSYWGKEGGITVSGGEPLIQIDFLIELFTLAKEEGIHTTLDTSGNPFTRQNPFFMKFQRLLEVTDLILLDIKQINEEKHIELTRQKNSNILDMAQYLSEIRQPVWIRHVLVPGLTDNDRDLKALNSFIQTLKNVEKVEVLPYHNLGEYKWKELGLDYPLKGVEPPEKDRVDNANRILHTGKVD
ncbi:pyruvate formate lyase activating enzyme [Aequitasia blattaphilus]|uniref:Pyruvate formate-lyase-activating enzyme n=1 Tax=Aequitasia blattaphilus TaxID=2949332 RepID=A0ABT1E740_9FIRM|nr:pyruvate formate-lyase-activating protein [Aequitasia blattaphilus]MCP1101531.1 pyruvate formate-lyase-activating protein [Aequitasia blattaphilus]MCR8614171.1 pyruvate formate-lyase-activating protein [Aequitasia blattaphilus]